MTMLNYGQIWHLSVEASDAVKMDVLNKEFSFMFTKRNAAITAKKN